MKVCVVCGGEFKNRGGKYCSTECSGTSSRNKRHGLCETPEYNSWTSMRERCNNTRRPAYQQYGARGITYCERWEVFENFLADMGPRPSPDYTLERLDNDGNYEPLNCKWASKLEQSQNRSNVWSEEDKAKVREGIELCLSNWQIAERLGVNAGAISSLIFKNGWRRTPEQISVIRRRTPSPQLLHDKQT